jgi:hypothetical protein
MSIWGSGSTVTSWISWTTLTVAYSCQYAEMIAPNGVIFAISPTLCVYNSTFWAAVTEGLPHTFPNFIFAYASYSGTMGVPSAFIYHI